METLKQKPKVKERTIQKACLDLLKSLNIYCYKINNGGVRKPNGSYIPAQTKGIPDIIFHSPIGVGYIEVKSETGRLSVDQVKFQQQCAKDNVIYWVIRDVDTLIRKINTMKGDMYGQVNRVI